LLRFEPPDTAGAVGTCVGGNPLVGLFPDVDREMLDEVGVSVATRQLHYSTGVEFDAISLPDSSTRLDGSKSRLVYQIR
jgi:hypothetical protein